MCIPGSSSKKKSSLSSLNEFLPLTTKKTLSSRFKKKPLPLQFSFLLLCLEKAPSKIFFNPQKNIFFPEKQISFSEKQISFSEKTNIFLFFVYVLSFLCPPYDLCCSHLFSNTFFLQPPFSCSCQLKVSFTRQSPTVVSKSEVDSLRSLKDVTRGSLR